MLKSCLPDYLNDYIEKGKDQDLAYHKARLLRLVYEFDTASTFQEKVTAKMEIDRVHGILNIYSFKPYKKVTFSHVSPSRSGYFYHVNQ